MIDSGEVALILRGWADGKRRLRLVARFGVFDFSAYCFVYEATRGGANFVVGNEPLNVVGFDFAGWVFDFTDPPSDDRALGVPGKIESAILGAKPGTTLQLYFFLLEE